MSINVFKTSLGPVLEALFLQDLGKSSLSFLGDTISRQTFQFFGYYNLSTQSLRCRGWVIDVSAGPGRQLFPVFGQAALFLMVSVTNINSLLYFK